MLFINILCPAREHCESLCLGYEVHRPEAVSSCTAASPRWCGCSRLYYCVLNKSSKLLLCLTYPGYHNVYQLFSIQHNHTLGDRKFGIVPRTIHKWTQHGANLWLYSVLLSACVREARTPVVRVAGLRPTHLCSNNVVEMVSQWL